MFSFDFYEFNKRKRIARFYYTSWNFKFCEELDFSNIDFKYELSEKLLNNILFFLHLLLWISYYKINCEKEIIVKSWYLNKDQADFFNDLYIKWLWEFFYKNNINFKWLINFPFSKKSSFSVESLFFKKEKLLVPLWWWKDSAVVLSLLSSKLDSEDKFKWIDYDVFTLWENQIYTDVSKNFWKLPIKVIRNIDPLLFKINEMMKNEDQFVKQDKNKRFYNGHVPISWIIAWVSLFVSMVSWYRYIVLANESSANVWNTIWKWMEINHQYSKSFEFEKNIQEFILNNITNITYFSLLRPFTELKISKIFSENCKDIFHKFSSCNKNFKIIKCKNMSLNSGNVKNNLSLRWEVNDHKWCWECPKCAFVFTMLSPFLWVKKVSEIFWTNLFKEIKLVKTFKDLIWFWDIKPFECVWTKEEVQSAFDYLISHPSKLEWSWNSCVIKEVSKYKLENNFDKYLNSFDKNLIPEKFLSLIK